MYHLEFVFSRPEWEAVCVGVKGCACAHGIENILHCTGTRKNLYIDIPIFLIWRNFENGLYTGDDN